MASIRKTRSGRFQAVVRVRGYPTVSRVFRTRSQARTWAQRVEDDMRLGTWRQDVGVTVGDVLDRYLREIVPLKKSWAFHRTNCTNLAKGLGRVLLARLTAQDVVAYVRSRPVSPSTVRKEVNTLSHAIDTAVALWGYEITGDPVGNAKRILRVTKALSPAPPRNRRLADGEEEALLAALGRSPETKLLALLTLATGRRLKELLSISDEVLVRRGGRLLLEVRDTKTDHPITVPLSAEAEALLEGFDGFTMRPDSYSQAFMRAVKRAGLRDLRLTDLRHEALSRLFERGLSVPEVMAISGHRSPDVLLRVYSQVDADRLSDRL